MGRTTDRVPERESIKLAFGAEIKWQFEDCNSEQVETGNSTGRSTLSAQEAAAKIWTQWKLCVVLSINCNEI